ncbi:MAG TPA: hypothetical protein VD947_00040 [Patescibacteria group bacterium]|nr:hypothetical protein [Patescibacteria group bacterium]
MDPKQNNPEPENTNFNPNPQPQVFRPSNVPNNSPEVPVPAATPQQPQQQFVPSPQQLPTQQPIPSNPVLTPYDTSKLFQPDSLTPVSEGNNRKGIFKIFGNRSGGGNGSKKKKLALVLAPLLAVIIAAAGIFGFYIPNRPDNVWNTGLDRSGEAIDKLVVDVTEKDQIEQLKKSEMTATIDVRYQDVSFSGSSTAKFEPSKLDGSLSFSSKEGDKAEQALKLRLLGQLAEGAVYPNIYVQLSGLKSLGAEYVDAEMVEYDGKWIEISEEYMKSFGFIPQENETKDDYITADDVSQIARAISGTTREYVLSSDKDKAVLEQRSFEGKEKIDGVTTYHYKAGINKAHAKDYCKALAERLISTDAYKKLPGVDKSKINEEKDGAKKECDESVDRDIKDNETFDVWVDSKYKLISKIRVYESDDKQSYMDIGQTYKGGDKLSLYTAFYDTKDKLEVKFVLDTDVKTKQTKGTITATWGENDSAGEVKVTFEAKPYTEELNVEKPEGTIPIKDILAKFGIDPSGISSGINMQSTDAARKSDINAIYSQLEVNFAINGFYPSLSELNDSSWRSANMSSLDEEALKAPGSKSAILGSSPSASQYGYNPTGCNSSGCAHFTLSAQLSDGNQFTKNSSN